jgi:hypothetical protein
MNAGIETGHKRLNISIYLIFRKILPSCQKADYLLSSGVRMVRVDGDVA